MRNKILLNFIILLTSALVCSAQANHPKEDTAQLTFSKTADNRQKSPRSSYTVQPGDVLSSIICRIPGIKQKDIPRYYRMTRELNPHLTHPDKLYAGQTLYLPGKSLPKKTISLSAKPPVPDSTPSFTYQVKKGDNLVRILHRELQISNSSQQMLRTIQTLNPSIKNINRIYAGQVIRLPQGQTTSKPGDQKIPSSGMIDDSEEIDPSLSQSIPAESSKQTITMTPATKLAVIKHIIRQMNGNMITSGKYYLPITKTEQLTIECSVMPVVELDDSTTLFLDFANRSGSHLNKIFSNYGKNYSLVPIDEKDNVIAILSKIFNKTKTFEITKAQNPVMVGSFPSVYVILDWLISRKTSKPTFPKTQGLRFIEETNSLLPRAVVSFTRTHSFLITEFSPETGLIDKPEEIYSLPPMKVLPRESTKNFAYELLTYLNLPAEKDVDVGIFNTERDGFQLSVKADLVATRPNKKILIFLRSLPPQFIEILNKTGNELLFLSPQDPPAQNMEKILRSFQVAFASGYFTLSGPSDHPFPYSIGFQGTKIKTDPITYVVDFDMHQKLRGLIKEVWSANMVRY